MPRIRPVLVALATLVLGTGGFIGATSTGARASDSTLCDFDTAQVSGGLYTVQNDEWDSSAPQCIATSGGTDFTVTSSSIANPTGGDPGGYPSIFAGCHWGDCTAGGLAAHPLPVAAIGPGTLTSSWDADTPDSDGDAYDVSYDLWINQAPTTSGAPDGTEVMVWLKDQGGVQPAGSMVASGVKLGAYSYDIWYQPGSDTASIVTYQMTSQRTQVTNLNIGRVIVNAEQRGYTSASWYLISVEAGFEIWQGGTGLATTSFSVRLTTARRGSPAAQNPSLPPPVSQPYRR